MSQYNFGSLYFSRMYVVSTKNKVSSGRIHKYCSMYLYLLYTANFIQCCILEIFYSIRATKFVRSRYWLINLLLECIINIHRPICWHFLIRPDRIKKVLVINLLRPPSMTGLVCRCGWKWQWRANCVITIKICINQRSNIEYADWWMEGVQFNCHRGNH